MKKIVYALAVLFVLAAACQKPELTREEENYLRASLNNPVHKLETYHFDPAAPVESRFGLPERVLISLRQYDNRPDYEYYEPTGAEKKLVLDSIAKLPEPIRESIRRRMIGIAFLNDFRGSGMTDFVLDEQGNQYFYLIFNAATLHDNLSTWLTTKEKTCFIAQPGFDIRVSANVDMSAFPYILAHESLHAIDYVNPITPFVEPFNSMLIRSRGRFPPEFTEFTRGVWKSYSVPEEEYRFDGRKKVTFYGFNNGPQLRTGEAAALYDALGSNVFASLYGSMNWAEDAAEWFAFSYLDRVYGADCAFECLSNGTVVARYSPMENTAVSNRVAAIWKKLGR